MAIYDFERCSVYLVEDNSYIRKVLEGLLHGIKFGRISSAPDGAEAIEFFKTLHASAEQRTKPRASHATSVRG